jgi:hypothetical protein
MVGKVDVLLDSLHVKRIAIEDLVGYVYIVRIDCTFLKNEVKMNRINKKLDFPRITFLISYYY